MSAVGKRQQEASETGWRLLLPLSLLVGCGPAIDASETPTATTGTMGSSTADSLEPVPDSCESVPASGIDPFPDDPACSDYWGEHEVAREPVEVRFVNRTGAPILVADRTWTSEDQPRHFAVSGHVGGRAVQALEDPCEMEACSHWGDDPVVCKGVTIHPSIYLQPGGWYSETWSAALMAEVTMPGRCNVPEQTDMACWAPLPLTAGTFEVTASAIAVSDCDEQCACRDVCDCVPDSRGSCLVPMRDALLDETSLVATAVYDGTCETIELAFEP